MPIPFRQPIIARLAPGDERKFRVHHQPDDARQYDSAPDSTYVSPPATDATRIAILQQRVAYYEGFHRLIQENINRAAEMMQLAADRRAEADQLARELTAERDSLRALRSETLRSLNDELARFQFDLTALSDRVNKALTVLENGEAPPRWQPLSTAAELETGGALPGVTVVAAESRSVALTWTETRPAVDSTNDVSPETAPVDDEAAATLAGQTPAKETGVETPGGQPPDSGDDNAAPVTNTPVDHAAEHGAVLAFGPLPTAAPAADTENIALETAPGRAVAPFAPADVSEPAGPIEPAGWSETADTSEETGVLNDFVAHLTRAREAMHTAVEAVAPVRDVTEPDQPGPDDPGAATAEPVLTGSDADAPVVTECVIHGVAGVSDARALIDGLHAASWTHAVTIREYRFGVLRLGVTGDRAVMLADLRALPGFAALDGVDAAEGALIVRLPGVSL